MGETSGLTNRSPKLARRLGLLDAVGIGIGAIVGAGIFVVLGVAVGVGGPAALVGLLLAAVAATANGLSSAQLAACYPVAGGTYEYGYRVLGPTAGYVAGWMFLAAKVAAAGAVAIGLSEYVAGLGVGVPARWIAVSAIIVFTWLNYRGIRRSSRTNLFIVATSVGSLLAFVFVAAGAGEWENLTPFAPAGARGVFESAALLFFAYTGYARVATLGEEVREPQTTIPRAIVITIGVTVVLYALVASTALGAVGALRLAGSRAPIRTAAEAAGTSWLPAVVSWGALAAMLGVILSQLLGLSRMVFAMARRGDLPGALCAVHPRHHVPHRAVVVVGAVATVVAATGALESVVSVAAFTILIYYGIANAAALRMRALGKLVPDVVPIVGLVSCTVLAVALSRGTVVVGLVVLVIGFVVRAIVRKTPPGARLAG